MDQLDSLWKTRLETDCLSDPESIRTPRFIFRSMQDSEIAKGIDIGPTRVDQHGFVVDETASGRKMKTASDWDRKYAVIQGFQNANNLFNASLVGARGETHVNILSGLENVSSFNHRRITNVYKFAILC